MRLFAAALAVMTLAAGPALATGPTQPTKCYAVVDKATGNIVLKCY